MLFGNLTRHHYALHVWGCLAKALPRQSLKALKDHLMDQVHKTSMVLALFWKILLLLSFPQNTPLNCRKQTWTSPCCQCASSTTSFAKSWIACPQVTPNFYASMEAVQHLPPQLRHHPRNAKRCGCLSQLHNYTLHKQWPSTARLYKWSTIRASLCITTYSRKLAFDGLRFLQNHNQGRAPLQAY